jgi:hypothetical protein
VEKAVREQNSSGSTQGSRFRPGNTASRGQS